MKMRLCALYSMLFTFMCVLLYVARQSAQDHLKCTALQRKKAMEPER